MADSLAGKLLVATPLLEDPNFYRTVIALLAHDEKGAFGVVLNRPLEGVEVDDHLPQWVEHVAAPSAVFAGGPVEPTMALGIAACKAADGGEDGWTQMAGDVGLLDLTLGPADLRAELRRLRVYSGYAGWGAGQLEGEIEQNACFVVDAQPDDLFSDEPDTLWRRILLRQKGDMKIYAFFPEDASAN